MAAEDSLRVIASTARIGDPGPNLDSPQHRLSSEYNESEGIKSPSPDDIICGRGKMTIAHPGNRKFRELVQSHKRAYQLARRRDDKTKITFDLVQQLREGGSKFLLFDSKTNLWYDVGDEYAREKVSHSLRSRPNEQRRAKPKPRKKGGMRKNPHSPALDDLANKLISSQQALLQTMIAKQKNFISEEFAENSKALEKPFQQTANIRS